MTDWLTPTSWTSYGASSHVVTRTELNEQVRDQLLYSYERRSPAIAAMFASLLVQDTGVAEPFAIDGLSLVNAEGTLYTVPPGKVLILGGLSVWNATATAKEPTIRIVESGGGAALQHTIFGETLYELEDIDAEAPWFLEAGDYLSGGAVGAAANEVSCRFDGLILAAQPPGHTLRMIDGVALTTSFAPVVTASGTEVVLTASVVNMHTAAVRVDVAVVESGGSVTNAKQIFGRDLEPRETAFIPRRPIVLENGDTLQMKAGTGAVVAVRPSSVRITS